MFDIEEAKTQDELEERYLIIHQCIANKTVLEIEYLSLDNNVSKRIIHPYKLYMYNNAWFVLGFDEISGGIRYFKINRIQNFVVQNRKFRVPLTYKESDYLDEYGMKQNGEWCLIKLKFTGKYLTIIKERVYGKEQNVEVADDNSVMLSCKMQNKDNILKFVLGFGVDCEVIEPEWLKEKVAETIKTMSEKLTKG